VDGGGRPRKLSEYAHAASRFGLARGSPYRDALLCGVEGFSEVRVLCTRLPTLGVHILRSAVLYIQQSLVPRITKRTHPTNVVLLLGEAWLERCPLPGLKHLIE
jgi:hypothetical protein